MPGNYLLSRARNDSFFATNPPDQADMHYWFRGDSASPSSGSLTAWTDKTGNGYTTGGPSGTVIVTPSDINGQTDVVFTGSATLSMGNNNTAVFDPGSPFSLSFVAKFPTAFTSGNYSEVLTMAGSTAANSATVFIYNPGSGTEFYIQTGSGTTTIETDPLSAPTAYSTFTLTYNGSGFGTPSNFTFQVNGVTQSLTASTGSGGDTNQNDMGGSSLSVGITMQLTELIQWSVALSGAELTTLNSYYTGRYAL